MLNAIVIAIENFPAGSGQKSVEIGALVKSCFSYRKSDSSTLSHLQTERQ
jgi:hypothetical protein